MRCNTHTATHCSTLQHTTSCMPYHRNTLQQHPQLTVLLARHLAVSSCVLQHTATHCNTLQQQLTVPLARQWTTSPCAATHTLQHTATRRNTLQQQLTVPLARQLAISSCVLTTTASSISFSRAAACSNSSRHSGFESSSGSPKNKN